LQCLLLVARYYAHGPTPHHFPRALQFCETRVKMAQWLGIVDAEIRLATSAINPGGHYATVRTTDDAASIKSRATTPYSYNGDCETKADTESSDRVDFFAGRCD